MKKGNLIIRQPVVVLVGHIDHGKSSILSKIKDFKITEKETGGITQHIGAYEVEEKGKKITFIDTPGHEAFSAMRARGAKVADIAILVVAADEGVQAQTKEAISQILKAEMPMIVAINKIDKSTANPAKVKRELAEQKVLTESLGGKIPSVNVSAVTGEGIEELLDLILLVAEMEELKADITKPAVGVIIESYLDSKRGPTATLLLEQGILKKGDIVGTSLTFGKIKRLENFQGKEILEGRPGMPLIALGFNEVPGIGEKFKTFSTLEEAKSQIELKERRLPTPPTKEPGKKVLNLILKTDVQGSIEPIEKVLQELPQEKIQLGILKTGVGDVGIKDIEFAEAAGAQIIGFRVKAGKQILRLVKERGVRIICFDLIYDLVEDVRNLMKRMVEPQLVREDLGQVKVLVIFLTKKNRQIVGGKITTGEVTKGTLIEVLRPASPAKRGEEDEKIGKGKLINLQKNKKDVDRLVKGDECGILYEGNVRIEKGDTLIIYKEEKRKTGL